jgi:hypothetical protein
MQRSRRDRKVFLALCANAAVLLLILLVLVERDNRLALGSTAMADPQAPAGSTGGNGLFVMPGQLSSNTWGCYLMDTDHQTLCVYQYTPAEQTLRLVAARSFRYDRMMGNYNTAPPPLDIRDLSERNEQKSLQP